MNKRVAIVLSTLLVVLAGAGAAVEFRHAPWWLGRAPMALAAVSAAAYLIARGKRTAAALALTGCLAGLAMLAAGVQAFFVYAAALREVGAPPEAFRPLEPAWLVAAGVSAIAAGMAASRLLDTRPAWLTRPSRAELRRRHQAVCVVLAIGAAAAAWGWRFAEFDALSRVVLAAAACAGLFGLLTGHPPGWRTHVVVAYLAGAAALCLSVFTFIHAFRTIMASPEPGGWLVILIDGGIPLAAGYAALKAGDLALQLVRAHSAHQTTPSVSPGPGKA